MRTYLFLLLNLLVSNVFCQKDNRQWHPIGLSGEYLLTSSKTIQTPIGGKQFICHDYAEGAFGLNIDLPINHRLKLETGYRWKQHWISLCSEFYGFGDWIETTHSIPMRIGIIEPLGQKRLLRKIFFYASGGVIFDFMAQSPSNPTVNNSAVTVGPYTITETFKPEDLNNVNAGVSLDGRIKMGCQIFRGTQIFLGYGFLKGFRTLAKATYSISGNGIDIKGTTVNKGSYGYVLLDLRYEIKAKSPAHK
jgi:hypothetical protein